MMRNKGQSQNMFIRIMSSPIRALGKARDAYVRSITNCGQSMSYGGGYPMDAASKFSSLSRSQSAATSRRSSSSSRRSTSSTLEGNEDYAELVRAASARTLVNRLDMDLVLKQQQQQKLNKGLPKSSSVGMAKIDEDMPFDSSIEGKIGFVGDSYPRSKSYAVGHRHRNVAF
ncbi:hypothetical protein TSUD_05780 [Trifolium subterraneum]|uniref:Uncharacterized protein n=1 Tax=Trifolium subterraneum TaxID=3900 RepID=A0A2Z6MQ94_TRISU|nr:hypothetical protein TSUD_05780 [Trifolium subterraneum]